MEVWDGTEGSTSQQWKNVGGDISGVVKILKTNLESFPCGVCQKGVGTVPCANAGCMQNAGVKGKLAKAADFMYANAAMETLLETMLRK